MKLAFVVHRYGGGIAGGSEMHCRQLAERLAARHDITVLTNPSEQRAIALDRAYLANVIEQSYVWGRDVAPARAHATIGDRTTGLGERGLVVRESTLRLDWR